MNAQQRHADFDISAEMAENVVKLKPIPAARPNAANLADLHRREGLTCQQRIADAKRQDKKNNAGFAAARKAAKAEYDAKLLNISEAESFCKENTALSIAEDEILVSYNSAALAALGG